ncbi:MAG: FAD-dependent oxidoreductase [Gammaproteobacteria bacterium]
MKGDPGVRVAIIGSGISGLYAARRLAETADVTVYEALDRAGGHSNTVDIELDGQRLAIDTGFIVFNEQTYPRFTALLRELGVTWQPSDMSFSFRCGQSGLEYRGDNNFDALFAQRRNTLRLSFYRMIRDILRFNRLGDALVASDPAVTLGEFLSAARFRGPVVENYLLPMAAAIWSADPARILHFPAMHFGRFFRNHGLLQVNGRPQWMTVTGGSREYVRALARPLMNRIRLNTPVESVRRYADRVAIKAQGQRTACYDQVIFACHSDQALALLSDPSDAEQNVLGAIAYQDNDAIVHTDLRLLPQRRRAWAAWNYHRTALGNNGHAAVTYNLTRLQNLNSRRQVLLTLNDRGDIDPRTILHRVSYSHPQFDMAAVNAQSHRAEISGVRRSWYCGAYWGFGFHEDGVQSAATVCESLLTSTRMLNLSITPSRTNAQLPLSGTA